MKVYVAFTTEANCGDGIIGVFNTWKEAEDAILANDDYIIEKDGLSDELDSCVGDETREERLDALLWNYDKPLYGGLYAIAETEIGKINLRYW